MQSNSWFISFGIFLVSIFLASNLLAQTVVINGQTLSQQEVNIIENTYGIQCQTGRYWYDNVSGLVGFEGRSPFTIMKAGYQFGYLDTKCSGGNTGVFFNGRELSTEEWTFWSQLNGSYIYKGKYWMDDKGNAGLAGNSTALVNFYARAEQYKGNFDQNDSDNNNYNGSGGNTVVHHNNTSNYNNYSKRQGNNGGGNAWGTKWSKGNSDGQVHVISSMWGVLDY